MTPLPLTNDARRERARSSANGLYPCCCSASFMAATSELGCRLMAPNAALAVLPPRASAVTALDPARASPKPAAALEPARASPPKPAAALDPARASPPKADPPPPKTLLFSLPPSSAASALLPMRGSPLTREPMREPSMCCMPQGWPAAGSLAPAMERWDTIADAPPARAREHGEP
jgi:hypothetical protein